MGKSPLEVSIKFYIRIERVVHGEIGLERDQDLNSNLVWVFFFF